MKGEPAVALEREIKTYNRLKSELQSQTGRFALIGGDDLIGTYDSERDALEAGYDRFKLDELFLVRKIGLVEPIIWRYGELLPCR
jgi:hypothetical protein